LKYFKNHIVVTTIFVPYVLKNIYDNLNKYGHLDSTFIWVISDKKTPKESKYFCESFIKNGLNIKYLDIDEQDLWGKKYPYFYSIIPYNNETRRNIGYLCALEQGCEILISIDDDNYPTNDDFIGLHEKTGQNHNGDLVFSNIGFYNICDNLKMSHNKNVYSRGFPFKLRGVETPIKIYKTTTNSKIGVTTGLWTKSPDVDAITWLNGCVESLEYFPSKNIILDHKTWCTINTQNTSVIRELVPAFFCIPMGYSSNGVTIERYGDILAGYFLQLVMEHTDFYVNIGRPIVEHRRNSHNYINDLRIEYWGMMIVDWVIDILKNDINIKSTNIYDIMIEISDYIYMIATNTPPEWVPLEIINFLKNISKAIKEWIKICQKII